VFTHEGKDKHKQTEGTEEARATFELAAAEAKQVSAALREVYSD
jgi:hypothetical protein